MNIGTTAALSLLWKGTSLWIYTYPICHGIIWAWQQSTQAWQKELFWISDCSVELSVTGETVTTLCTDFRVPKRGTFSKCMNEFTMLSTELCAFTLLITLWWWWLHFSYRLALKLKLFCHSSNCKAPGFSLRVAGHGCKAVPQEGLRYSCLAALARVFLCPPVSWFYPWTVSSPLPLQHSFAISLKPWKAPKWLLSFNLSVHR